jgi:phosphoglycerate dehydrogenase-like enzyme
VSDTIYVTDGTDWLNTYREQLEQLDPPVEVVTVEGDVEVVRAASDASGLIADPALLSDAVLAGLTGLKSLQFTTTEFHHLDLPVLEKRGVALGGVNRALAPPAAQHLIDLTAATARLIGHPGVTGVPTFPEFENKVIGIVGYGYTGSELIRQLEGTRCEYRYTDVRTPARDDLGETKISRLTLDRVLVESDYVFILVPLTSQTRGLFDLREFRIMKPEAVLINGSHPDVIVADDLLTALNDGLFAGAAIAYRDDELESHQRVVALSYPNTPPGHIAERAIGSIAENLDAVRANQPLPAPVESIDFPVAGDPSFWSSRFTPRSA